MTNTTPKDKVSLDVKDEPQLKTLVSKLQPGDSVIIKSAKLQLDQSDDNVATFSILEIEFAQPKGAASGGGDTALTDEPGLKVIKGDLEDEAEDEAEDESETGEEENQNPPDAP